MDAFETRMQFLTQLRRLTSAAQSINKVVAFLLKQSIVPQPGPRKRPASESNADKATHGESDLWDCIMEELEKASINARMNIFYMLDSLLDQSLALGVESYRAFVVSDLEKIVNFTVPTHLRDGVLNRMSTMQVLSSWKTRRILPINRLEALLDHLRDAIFSAATGALASQSHAQSFSKQDILRRIEDDRERHKRLRERIWVLPIPTLHDISANPSPSLSTVLSTRQSPASPAVHDPKLVSLAAYAAEHKSLAVEKGPDTTNESALDVEFEQLWETIFHGQSTRKLNHDDLKAMRDESLKCFGG